MPDTEKNNKNSAIESEDTSSRLVSGIEKINAHLDREHVLHKSFLKQKWFRTIALLIVIAGPTVFYGLLYSGVISSKVIDGKYVSLIRIDGEISPGAIASADKLVPVIEKACEDKESVGLILRINSPGGSPVQAALIHDAINRCRDVNQKKIIAVAEDVIASGSYWLAAAADEIYVNESTITGSIGVKLEGFGLDFEKYLGKYGIERRVLTAGENKVRMDMFSGLSERDKEKSREILNELHQNFINAVLASRKDKIKEKHDIVFSGDFWTGRKAKEMGLVDGISDVTMVMKDKFQVSDMMDYTPRPGMFDNFKSSFSIHAMVNEFVNSMSTASTPRYVAK